MSKIGEKPITIPEGVNVQIKDGSVSISGPEGTLALDIPRGVQTALKDNSIRMKRRSDSKRHKALHGLARSLVANAVSGVNKKWEKRLKVVGTGYRVKMQGTSLGFEVGYSHPVVFEGIEGVDYAIEGKNIVVVSGVDRQLVGQVAHRIRTLRPPDPYKGKGIRYEREELKLKPGKKAKAATEG